MAVWTAKTIRYQFVAAVNAGGAPRYIADGADPNMVRHAEESLFKEGYLRPRFPQNYAEAQFTRNGAKLEAKLKAAGLFGPGGAPDPDPPAMLRYRPGVAVVQPGVVVAQPGVAVVQPTVVAQPGVAVVGRPGRRRGKAKPESDE